MARFTPISIEESKIYVELIVSGLTQNQAAKHLGRSRKCLNESLNKYSLPLPKPEYASVKIEKRYDEYVKKTVTVKELSKQYDVSEIYVRKIFCQVSASRGSKDTVKDRMAARYQPVVDYLKKHGGYVKHALIAVGLNPGNDRRAKRYCREIGFPYEEYVYAFRTYGYWKSIPGPVRASTTKAETRHITCQCTLCGSIHQVDIVNMISGKSTKCFACGQDKGKSKVKCIETGKEFKTLAEWLRAIDMVPQRTTLVQRLRHDKRIEINGLNYRIITPRRRRS